MLEPSEINKIFSMSECEREIIMFGQKEPESLESQDMRLLNDFSVAWRGQPRDEHGVKDGIPSGYGSPQSDTPVNAITVAYSGDHVQVYVPGGYINLPDTDPIAKYIIGCMRHTISQINFPVYGSTVGNLDPTPKQARDEYGYSKVNYPDAVYRQRG